MPATCTTGCNPTLPPLGGTDCGLASRKGGINRLIIARRCFNVGSLCDNLEAELAPWVEDCAIRITGQLLSDKPATATTSALVASCLPEVVTGQTHTLNFQDFAVNREAEDFYAAVMDNPADFAFAWVDCDGNLYGIQQTATGEYTFTPGTVTVDHIIPQSNQESQSFTGVVTMQFRGVFKSYRADAFVNLLLANQNNGCDPYYSPSDRECPGE